MAIKILIGIILALIFPFLDYFLISLGMGAVSLSFGLYLLDYTGDKTVISIILVVSLVLLDVAFHLFLGTFLGLFIVGLLFFYVIDAIVHLNTWWKRNVAYFFVFFIIYYLLGLVFTYSKISLDNFLAYSGEILFAALKNALFGWVWLFIIKTVESVLIGGERKSIRVY